MSTPFLSYAFPATGAASGSARSLPARLAEVVNVKDFGATGDGHTNDTIAIKAAFAAAWGPPEAPNAYANRGLNKPVFFPAGDYIVTDTIYVVSVCGGSITGEGSRTTRLIYAGLIPNNLPASQNKTNLFMTNGFGYCRIEGIAFVMTGGNTEADNTVCFNWNWNWNTNPEVNTTHPLFIDVGFEGGTYGCLMSDDEGSPNWGAEGDIGLWFNCWINDCWIGNKSTEANCINCGWFGGSVKNCSSMGFYFRAPSTFMIQGVDFSNNNLDILVGATPICITGCRSTSPHFCTVWPDGVAIVGCEHKSVTTPSIFVDGGANSYGVTIDNCRTNGTLAGQGNFYIRETQFYNPIWSSFSGRICELATTDSFNFADLPPVGNAAEGLTVSIKDSPTATWGATVSGGSGSNHVLLNSSGAHARGAITFSAQPDDLSTLTLGGNAILMHDGTKVGEAPTVNRGANLAECVDNLVAYINSNLKYGQYGVYCSASGTPHDTINLTAYYYGRYMNGYGLVASTSPASHGTVSAGTLLGGTAPVWTVVGK
jgi:Pectate lyase superfamily protein